MKKSKKKLTPIQKLNRLRPGNKIPINVAQRFIIESSYWHDHPSGRPVHAPKHYKRVTSGKRGWEIEFGANVFYVGLALEKCIDMLKIELEKTGQSKRSGYELRASMRLALRSCVANFEGTLYDYYSAGDDRYMKLGSQAINIENFIDTLLNYVNYDSN